MAEKNSGHNPVKILAFDTATPFCTAAIVEGTTVSGKVLGTHSLTGPAHSRKLLAAIDMLMRELALGWQDISGIATGLGPGSFTGLRIGLATAKGLATASGLPLLGCSTLEVVAAGCGVRPRGERVIAVLDARKQEVYVEGFIWRKGCLRPDIEKSVLSPSDFTALLHTVEGEILLAGDGAVLYRPLIEERCGKKIGDTIRFAGAEHNQPQAAVLGFLGAERLAREEELDVAGAVPFYVRKSDAELNCQRKKARQL